MFEDIRKIDSLQLKPDGARSSLGFRGNARKKQKSSNERTPWDLFMEGLEQVTEEATEKKQHHLLDIKV